MSINNVLINSNLFVENDVSINGNILTYGDISGHDASFSDLISNISNGIFYRYYPENLELLSFSLTIILTVKIMVMEWVLDMRTDISHKAEDTMLETATYR